MTIDVIETLGWACLLFVFVVIAVLAGNLVGLGGSFLVCVLGAVGLQWMFQNP